MRQHGMRQVSCDTDFGKVTADCRVLDVWRPIWSLGSTVDPACDAHFTKDRCWISKEDGKELDMIRSGVVFFVAARPAKPTSKDTSTLELNPMTAAEVETAALAREDAAFGVPGPARWTAMESPQYESKFPRALSHPQPRKEHCMRLRSTCRIAARVNGALRLGFLLLSVMLPSSPFFGWCCVPKDTNRKGRREESTTTPKEEKEGSITQQKRLGTQLPPKGGEGKEHHLKGDGKSNTTQTNFFMTIQC